MYIQERSYAGKYFRPRPEVVHLNDENALMILTIWGDAQSGNDVSQQVRDFFSSAYVSNEMHGEALLQSVVKFANELIYTTLNSNEYSVVVEGVWLLRDANMLYWASVGGPHILLKQSDVLHPINYEVDWTLQKKDLSPLPSKGLGIDAQISVRTGFAEISDAASVLLVSRSELPSHLYSLQSWELIKISERLSEHAVDMPFWVALVDL